MTTPWYEAGSDPDYRFSLANERTFLAWIRTALAILAGAILLHQVQSSIDPVRWSAMAGGAVALFSTLIAVCAYFRWRSNEIAMRHGRSLPRSSLILLMTSVAGLIAAFSAVAMLRS
jgi:putative membrane protein